MTKGRRREMMIVFTCVLLASVALTRLTAIPGMLKWRKETRKEYQIL